MKKVIRIKKVNVESLIQTLGELFMLGVEYVDIAGEEDESIIAIYFNKNYMTEGLESNFDNISHNTVTPSDKKIKLTDEDLDKLV